MGKVGAVRGQECQCGLMSLEDTLGRLAVYFWRKRFIGIREL